MDQNSENSVLINNTRTACLIKILMPFFEFLRQSTKMKCTSFFIKVLMILRYSIKHVNFWLGCSTP